MHNISSRVHAYTVLTVCVCLLCLCTCLRVCVCCACVRACVCVHACVLCVYTRMTSNILIISSSFSTVVCYCSVGYRSSLVAQRLYRHYKEHRETCPPLHNLEGGLFQWANEGRPLAISNTVHPYSSAWGILLDSKLRSQI